MNAEARWSWPRIFFQGDLRVIGHEREWNSLVAHEGYEWHQVLVAAGLRTKPGGTFQGFPPSVDRKCPGLSRAILACPSIRGDRRAPVSHVCYLPAGTTPGEDRVIGSAIGMTSDMELLQIRRLLHTNSPLPRELYGQVGNYLGVAPEVLESFGERPLREFYVEGLCGGAVLPLGRIGRPAQDVHVSDRRISQLLPVFFLAGRLVARALGLASDTTHVNAYRRFFRPFG